MHMRNFLITLYVCGLFVVASAQTNVAPPKSSDPNTGSRKSISELRAEQEKRRSMPAQKKGNVPDVPLTNARIAFDQIVFDFGDVPGGTKVTHYFLLLSGFTLWIKVIHILLIDVFGTNLRA